MKNKNAFLSTKHFHFIKMAFKKKKNVSHGPISQMKSQQSSGFKPRPPNSKFSAPSGFQHEDRNYKVWDQPGLQIRMKSSYSKRAFEISRTSGQTGTQSPQDAAEKVQKHRTEPPFIRLILCARCCFVYISNLHNNTARRTLSSFCIDKGNKGSKIN